MAEPVSVVLLLRALAELAADALCRGGREDARDIARGSERTREDAGYWQGSIDCGLAHARSLTWQRAAREMSTVYAGLMAGS